MSIFHGIITSDDVPSVTWLASFFGDWPENFTIEQPAPPLPLPEPVALAQLLSDFSTTQRTADFNTLQFDPWEIAGVGHKEVRNQAVFAWLLNPDGSHGLGNRALHGLLALLPPIKDQPFPADHGRWLRINCEVRPTGNAENRVDIEIDSERFYLLIELKINALEQREQLSRYHKEAFARAGERPWRVLFITPQGRLPISGTPDEPRRYPSLSWRSVALQLARVLDSELQRYAASSSPAQQAVAWSIHHFLRRLRHF